MPYPGQVFEDPDYYEEDEEFDPSLLEEDESDFDPFNTVNS